MSGFGVCVLAERILADRGTRCSSRLRTSPRRRRGRSPDKHMALERSCTLAPVPVRGVPRSILGAVLFLAQAKPFLEEISQGAPRLFLQASFRDMESLVPRHRRVCEEREARLHLCEVLTRLILETEPISSSCLGHLPGSQSPLLLLLNRDSSGCRQGLFPCG